MPLMARDFSRLPPAVICAAELDVVLPDALEYAAALDAAGVPQRLIVGHGLPHTFLRALHFCGAAERAFVDFARAMAELLRDVAKTAVFGIDYVMAPDWSAIVCDRVVLHSGARIKDFAGDRGMPTLRRRALKGDNARLGKRENGHELMGRVTAGRTYNGREANPFSATGGGARRRHLAGERRAGEGRLCADAGGRCSGPCLGAAGGSTTDSMDVRTYLDTVMINISTSIFDGLVRSMTRISTQAELLETLEPQERKPPNGCATSARASPSATARRWRSAGPHHLFHQPASRRRLEVGRCRPHEADQRRREDEPGAGEDRARGTPRRTYGRAQRLSRTVAPERFRGLGQPGRNRRLQGREFRPRRSPPTPRTAAATGRKGAATSNSWNSPSSTMMPPACKLFLAGEFDVTHRVVVPLVDQLLAAGIFKLVQAAAGYHFNMPMMVRHQAVQHDLDTRLAMKYAINRAKLVEMLFGKYARVGNDHPIPESDRFHNNELPQRVYDPEQAAFHAKKAGLSTADVTLSASDAAFNGAIDMSVLFQATAGAAGIPVKVRPQLNDGFWDNVWLKAPFMTSYRGGRPAATQMLAAAYGAQAPWNDTHWRVDAFEKLLADAKALLPTTTSARTYIWEMQRMLYADGGAIIPLFKDWLDVHDVKVKGHTPRRHVRSVQQPDRPEGLDPGLRYHLVHRRRGIGPAAYFFDFVGLFRAAPLGPAQVGGSVDASPLLKWGRDSGARPGTRSWRGSEC